MTVQAQKGTFSAVVGSQGMTNSATVTANLDCSGADYASLVINLGSEINTNAVGPTISVLDSDDTVVTNFATIVADRTAEDITTAKALVYHFRPAKRYARVSVTTATTTNDNVEVSVTGLLTRKGEAPSALTEMADAAVVVVQ